MTRLSICIPTYNFGRFIGQTLDSILPDLTKEVEVIILDGGSTDDTTQVVAQRQQNSSQIRYYRQKFRGGIDRDLAKAVSLACGEYCWLFSADDIMKRGAITEVLTQIKEGHDLYLCKHTTLGVNSHDEYPVLHLKEQAEFNLADPLERQRYFKLAQSNEAFFSFICGIIIKKSKWESVPINETFVGSCLGHVSRIFELMSNSFTIKYFPKALLEHRPGIDSFTDNCVVNYGRLWIDGYNKLGDIFFGHNSIEAYHIRRVIRQDFNLIWFLAVKARCKNYPSHEDKNLLNSLFHKVYSDTPLRANLYYLIYTFFPVKSYLIMKKMYRTYKKALS